MPIEQIQTNKLSALEKDLLTIVENSGTDNLKTNLSVPRERDESIVNGFEKGGYTLSARYRTVGSPQEKNIRITDRHFVVIPPEWNKVRKFSPTEPYEIPELDRAIKLFSENNGPEKTQELEAMFLDKAIHQQEADIRESKRRIEDLKRKLYAKGIKDPMAADTPETRNMANKLRSLEKFLPILGEDLANLLAYKEQVEQK